MAEMDIKKENFQSDFEVIFKMKMKMILNMAETDNFKTISK